MGYKRKLYTLKWEEGHDLHGLEVVTKGLTVERFFKMTTLAVALSGDSPDQAENTQELFGEFAKCLIRWNLEEDDGTPVPANQEGIATADMGFMIGLVMTWLDAVAGVDIPLPKPSPNGAIFPEESLPVEALSASPLN